MLWKAQNRKNPPPAGASDSQGPQPQFEKGRKNRKTELSGNRGFFPFSGRPARTSGFLFGDSAGEDGGSFLEETAAFSLENSEGSEPHPHSDRGSFLRRAFRSRGRFYQIRPKTRKSDSHASPHRGKCARGFCAFLFCRIRLDVGKPAGKPAGFYASCSAAGPFRFPDGRCPGEKGIRLGRTGRELPDRNSRKLF